MKLILLFYSIFFYFALIKEVSSNNIDPLMLIGFENFSYQENGNITFNILFKKYNNSDNYSIASIRLYLFNGTASDNLDKNCTNISSTNNDDELKYMCNFPSPYSNVVQVKLININFTFYNGNKSYNPNIKESSLAKDTKNNIISQHKPLNFDTFNFDSFSQIKDDKILINGSMIPKITENINGGKYTLNLTNTTYYCKVDNNSISFDLINRNINENLIGKMLNLSTNDPKILIFSNSNSKNDLLMYSTVKSSSIELYGFENYTKPQNENAKNVVVFFGTPNILRKYVRFTSKIRYGANSPLRLLDEIETNATGTIDPESTDLDNGVAKYKTIYENTENISNILGIESLHDYKFADDKDKFQSNPFTLYIVGDDINLINAGKLADYAFINFTDKPIIDGNTFSLKFKLKSQNSALNITNKQPAFLNYSSMETSQRDVIDSCSIENNTNILTINCEPKKDIYALLNTLIIKVPNITQNRRLRFLQSSGNSTIRSPITTLGDIQFEYNPEMNTFARKASKKKGLSGGAIAAIVLATIAAVAAVAVAMFFLNRGPINPIKTSTEMNLPNSSTNINN